MTAGTQLLVLTMKGAHSQSALGSPHLIKHQRGPSSIATSCVNKALDTSVGDEMETLLTYGL